MKPEQTLGNEARNMINGISGVYTLRLIDNLFPAESRVSDMEDIYTGLTALSDGGKPKEAMHMLRGLFGVAGIDYPYLMVVFEAQEETQQLFMSEFLADYEDIMESRRFDEEERRSGQ